MSSTPPLITNAEYAKTNEYFRRCCKAAGVEPTTRQAGRFRNKHGSAYAAASRLHADGIDNTEELVAKSA